MVHRDKSANEKANDYSSGNVDGGRKRALLEGVRARERTDLAHVDACLMSCNSSNRAGGETHKHTQSQLHS